MPQRADEVVLAHQHGAAAGVQDVDGAAWGRPVGRGMARTCSIRLCQRPASVRLEVPGARRRMLPSQAISVTTALTRPVCPCMTGWARRGAGAAGAGPAVSRGRAGQMPGALLQAALLIQRSPDTAVLGAG